MRKFSWLLVGMLAGSIGWPARAQEPVLHEYVPNVDPREASLGSASSASSENEGAPAAADGPHEDADEPSYNATPGDGSLGEPAGQRSPAFRPDRLTELANGLDYYEVFRPSIAPFKRVSSLGQIQLDDDGKTPVLGVRSGKTTLVRIEGEASAPPDARPRDRFRAEVTLDFSSGAVVPLPSVSPESRILTWQATPPVTLRIERDLDDNFAVRAVGVIPQAPVRVAFVTDAPRSYFASEIPDGRVSGLELEVPSLEPSIERRGLAMARRLGLSRKSELRSAIATLTRYFRGFQESSAPPDNTGDTYVDLFRSQKGICRHRAYGFVVTAQALGIPTRFVQNEAHSWVEVKLPRLGFLRIDLGGAANGLTAHNTSDEPSYVPSQPDPLPQPASYRRSVAQAAARATGPRPGAESISGRWVDATPSKPAEAAPASLTSDPAAASPARTPDQVEEVAVAAQSGRRPVREALALTLATRELAALRGSQLPVRGRVVDRAGQGVAGLRIEAWIAAPGRPRRMLLGVCVSDARGEFQASLGVPPDLAVGDYALVVSTPGNAKYAAATAR